MATNKTNSNDGKQRASRPENKSLPARTGRTLKERPYTSAAIATGAITAVAAAAAGAFFFSRRDKSLAETAGDLTTRLKDSFAGASDKFKELTGAEETRTQQEIAEEALTLKETGAAASPVDAVASDQSKVGAVAY